MRDMQMITALYAYDHNIIMHMMICEEWEMTSPIETTEWRRWNINMLHKHADPCLTD